MDKSTDTILLIEDDPACAAAVRSIFRRGHAVRLVVAETLAEGIALAQAAAITILDLTLPDATREQTLASIPTLREASPVIVLTAARVIGETDAETIERAMRLGADAVIFKPFAIADLIAAVLAARLNPRPCHGESERVKPEA